MSNAKLSIEKLNDLMEACSMIKALSNSNIADMNHIKEKTTPVLFMGDLQRNLLDREKMIYWHSLVIERILEK